MKQKLQQKSSDWFSIKAEPGFMYDIKQKRTMVFLRNNYIDDPQLDKAISLLQ